MVNKMLDPWHQSELIPPDPIHVKEARMHHPPLPEKRPSKSIITLVVLSNNTKIITVLFAKKFA
jgi:hypothetical protein